MYPPVECARIWHGVCSIFFSFILSSSSSNVVPICYMHPLFLIPLIHPPYFFLLQYSAKFPCWTPDFCLLSAVFRFWLTVILIFIGSEDCCRQHLITLPYVFLPPPHHSHFSHIFRLFAWLVTSPQALKLKEEVGQINKQLQTVQTYTHTNTHTHIYIHTHTDTNTFTHADTQTHIHTYTHTLMH